MSKSNQMLKDLYYKLPFTHRHYGYEVSTNGYFIECEKCGRWVLNTRKIMEEAE